MPAPPADPRAPPAPRIEFATPPFPLPFALRDSIRFGYLEVPRDHADSNGPTYRIAIAILNARTTDPAPDPLIFIPGGPGEAVIERDAVRLARSPRIDLLRRRRDFIIVEPRAHGLSEPRLCEEVNAARPLLDGLAAAEAVLARELSACRQRLGDAGDHLETVSSVAAARDIGLLRHALGAPRVNLIGGSYGTRIALEAMRQVPEAIRAVNLNGPVPAGADYLADDAVTARAASRVLVERCAERPECRRAYPRLGDELDSLLASVRLEPLVVRFPRSEQMPDGTLLIDEELLVRGLAELLSARELISGAPLLIHGLSLHGSDLLTALAPRLIRELGAELRYATHLAFLCNDSPAVAEPAWLRQRCPAWIGERYRPAVDDPVTSDIPTLILAGEFDPRTPPAYARTVASTLSRAQVAVLPWYGHDFRSDCGFQMTAQFFDAPDRPADATCLDSVPPVRFVSGVVPSRWIARAVATGVGHPIVTTTVCVAAFVLLLVPVAWLPLRARRTRAMVDPGPARSRDGVQATLVLWLAAATGLIFLVAVALALFVGARQHFLVPAIGVPGGWRWVLALPWLVGGATVVALLLLPRAVPPTVPAFAKWSALIGLGLTLGPWVVFELV
ncbi:MAG TPA: alpha/beta fold hydrolase [Gemmatimonadaceae bacterium]|nr:alpha/beta fold hydrolase [Gemmatimonadaceae bacterium]